MDIDTILDHSVGLIAKGLIFRWREILESAGNRNKYPRNTFSKGAAMFLAMCRKEGGLGDSIFPYAHERAFVEHFCLVPVSQWLDGFNQEAAGAARTSNAYYCGPLAEKCENGHAFRPTEECHEFIYSWFRKGDGKNKFFNNLLANMDERIVFNLLCDLHQIEPQFYVYGRELLIRNPVLFSQEDEDAFLDPFRKNHRVAAKAAELIGKAYECVRLIAGTPYHCPSCGWIASDNFGLRCPSKECTAKVNDLEAVETRGVFPKRLRPGVMRFIGLPGKLELNIKTVLEKACSKSDMTFEMWPERDQYDMRVSFPDGEVWVVDAKDYSSLENLRGAVFRDNGFPKGRWDHGFYVVPDRHSLREIGKMCDLSGIEGCEKVECLNLSGFERKLMDNIGRKG